MTAWPQLPVPTGTRRRLALAWLALALTALAISTVFALSLVVARTPFIAHWLSPEFFRGALVMHVNLAVTVWFLAFAGLWWSLAGQRARTGSGWLAWTLAAGGVGLLLLARLLGERHPILSNYVPVIDGPVFLAGLGLFLSGIGGMALRALAETGRVLEGGPRQAARITLLALGVLLATALRLPAPGRGYENLFWGGGHLLQFTHLLLMLTAWAVLAGQARLPAPRLRLAPLFAMAALPALFAPLVVFLLPAGSEAWRAAWTGLMRWGSWPVAAAFGGGLLWRLWRRPGALADPACNALGLSILLFAAGFLAGALIREDNVVVTAHYHGTVGAVTLAFMAITHWLLARLGLAATPASRVRRQLRFYGGGLLLLVAGLLWSGLHGVPRKTPGTAMFDQIQEWAGMLLMGLGGFIGLAATVWFLWLVLRPLWPTIRRGVPAGRLEEAR